MKRSFVLVVIILMSITNSPAQNTSGAYSFIDTVYTKLKSALPEGWNIVKHGSRIVFTKSDSVLCATAESDYKPLAPLSIYPPVKYKIQLYLDFTDKSTYPNEKYLNSVNAGIDTLIKKADANPTHTKQAYAQNEEQKKLLKRIRSQNGEIVFLKYVNARFDDNYPDDWIVYEYKDVENAPFKKPSVLQLGIEQLKKSVIEELKKMSI